MAKVLLTREKLLGNFQRRYADVVTPLGEARIRNLTENEKSEFEASVLTAKGDFSLANVKRQRVRLIIRCLVDEQGKQILQDSDAAALGPVDGVLTSQLYKQCREHCGFEEGDIEELVKNSGTLDADSPTA